jgi:hypothetical protein
MDQKSYRELIPKRMTIVVDRLLFREQKSISPNKKKAFKHPTFFEFDTSAPNTNKSRNDIFLRKFFARSRPIWVFAEF